ncbi:hypothetical protein BGZ49_002312, partial [Haplosporangium sp. Z 27]
ALFPVVQDEIQTAARLHSKRYRQFAASDDEAESSRTRKKSRPAKANDDDTNEESSARKEKKKVRIIVEKEEEVDDDEWEDEEEEEAGKADPDYTSSVRSSLTTIDMRYINNLVGPGTTSSKLRTEHRLSVDGVDVSLLLMEARMDIVMRQSDVSEVSDLLTRDPLPTPIGFEEIYLPDYFAEKDGFAFAVVEVKKPVADGTCLQADQRKVPSMMKIMLDMMYTAGVKDPVTLGFVIAKSRCDIHTMSVEHEALYMYKLIGSFELPKSNIQLGLLFAALAPLTTAQIINDQ